MDDDSVLNNFILSTLFDNEFPISAQEISDIIISKNLYSFHGKPPSTKSELIDYIDDYLSEMTQYAPNLCNKTLDGKYIFTPSEDLVINYSVSIQNKYFSKYKDINEIIKHIPLSDDNLGILIILSTAIEPEDNINDLLLEFADASDPRLRYVGLITLMERESDLKKKNGLINKGLNDPNLRIKAAALKSITHKASSEVISKLTELIDDVDLFPIAMRAAFEVYKPPIFEKLLELAKSPEDELAQGAISMLMRPFKATLIPSLFKIIEDWEDYKDNFNKHGYKEEDVKETLIQFGRSYKVFPKNIKQTVIEYCNSDNWVLQNTALKIMKNKWAKTDLEIIEKMETNQNPLAKQLKLKAMVKKESRSSLAKAKQYLNDPVELVKDTAIEALGEIGGEEELKLLIELGKDIDNYNTALIIEAVNKIKKKLIGKVK